MCDRGWFVRGIAGRTSLTTRPKASVGAWLVMELRILPTPSIIGCMDDWQLKDRKIVFEHPWVRIIVDTLSRGELDKPYILIESPVDAVATVAITSAHEIVLTRQYRHPVERIITDLPAGRANP